MNFVPVEPTDFPTQPSLETISLEFRVIYEGRFGKIRTEKDRVDMVMRLMNMAHIPIDIDQAQKYLDSLRYLKSTDIPF